MKRQKQRVDKDLQGLYQEAPIGLCSLDTNLRYLQINDWLAALNGLPVEAHLGRTLREVLPDVAAGVEQQLRKVIETGEPLLDGRVDAETPLIRESSGPSSTTTTRTDPRAAGSWV